MSRQKGQAPHKKPKAEKRPKWEVAEETPSKPTKVTPKRTPADDQGSGSDLIDDSSSEEVEETYTKADLKKWKKDLKQGRITPEEFDKLRKVEQLKVVPTEEEKKAAVVALAEGNALQDYKPIKNNRFDNKSRDVKIESITLSYKGKPLLVDTDLVLNHGRKYGLIGPNGSGKSTLLKHISMRHLPIPDHINILHVEQEVEGIDETALEAVVRADQERESLLAEEKLLIVKSQENTDEGLEAGDRLLEVYDRLTQIGSRTAESRAAAILAGLQFSQEMQKKKTKEFSGGWRMRISLARALFIQPTLLLLDEPTNHLDLDASIWLETYLKKYKKTLLLVSHDREFLTSVVTDIIDLREQKLDYYKGNYEAFERLRAERKAAREKAEKLKKKALERAQREQTAGARDTIKEIEKNGKVKKHVEKDYNVHFIFRDPPKLKIPVLQVKNTSFAYPGKDEIFKNLELNLDCDSKIAIVGPNGAGKTTLVNMILGELEPTSGEIYRNPHLKIAKFSQHFVDQLTMTDTPVEYIAKKFVELKPQEVMNKLGMFGLGGTTHDQRISLLSGGQKSRVCLCELSLTTPHILFLDEPTNHLDIQSVDALAEALLKWKGGVIFITHDQRLVSRVGKELWICKGDTQVIRYEGEFEDYKQEIINEMPDEWFLSDED